MGGRVTVNSLDARFSRVHLFDSLDSTRDLQSLNSALSAQANDLEGNDGELRIAMPHAIWEELDAQRVIKIGIDVRVLDARQVRIAIFTDSLSGRALRVRPRSRRTTGEGRAHVHLAVGDRRQHGAMATVFHRVRSTLSLDHRDHRGTRDGRDRVRGTHRERDCKRD